MTRHHVKVLEDASRALPSGYAQDIINWLIEPDNNLDNAKLEVGDLFRSLVLDEGWDVLRAEIIYNAGVDRIDDILNPE